MSAYHQQEAKVVSSRPRKVTSTDDNYIIVKYKKLQKLKASFNQLHERRKIELESSKSEFSLFQTITTVWQKDFNDVDDYWQDDKKKITKKLDDIEMYSAVIIQHAFRYWTFLAKHRRRLKELRAQQQQKTGGINILKISEAEKEMLEKKRREEEEAKKWKQQRFQMFCQKLAGSGEVVSLFNTYDGSTRKTTLRFDKQRRKLIYSGSGFFASSLGLNTIYYVAKGLPESLRSIAPLAHNPWCIHLKSTSTEIFFQAEDGDRARLLYEGLVQIYEKLFTMQSFYVDEAGIVRRLGPSIITKAIEGCSE